MLNVVLPLTMEEKRTAIVAQLSMTLVSRMLQKVVVSVKQCFLNY